MSLDGARCEGRWDLFEATDLASHAEAAAICAECPALMACRELLHGERGRLGSPSGTWAGMLLGTKRKPREHGTERGYQQHRHLQEKRCEPCRLAHNQHISRTYSKVAS